MAFNERPAAISNLHGGADDQSGDRILILDFDTGRAKLTEVEFSYTDGPVLVGNKAGLLSDWTEKLRGQEVTAFVREGF
jgi:hypothetical protein